MTHTDEMLRLLRDAGPAGIPNYKLSQISLQYNANIHEMRHKRGIDVRKRKISKGTYVYYIFAEKLPTAMPRTLEEANDPNSPGYSARIVPPATRPAKIDDLEPAKPEQGTSIGTYVFKGHSYGPNGPQTGQTYELTVGKLEVGRPVRIIAPFELSYPDVNRFNKAWGVPK